MNIARWNEDGSPAATVGCEVCPLSRVKTGVAVRIKEILAAPGVLHHLREIGLGEEQIVRLLTSQGNFICLVCNARLAISAQLAQLILVEPLLAPVKNGREKG